MPQAPTIVSIGCEIPGGFSEYVHFDSKTSLLDYDITLFMPDISRYFWSADYYQGKPSLDDSRSFKLLESAGHWAREIPEAIQAGKTVFVLMSQVQEVYVDTGRREYSGTGRNRQTIRMVSPFHNYQMLPGPISVTTSRGRAMVLTDKAEVLADYWTEFGPHSQFLVLVEGSYGKPLVVTRSGRKVVGLSARLKGYDGVMVLLPYLDLEDESFTSEYEADSDDDDPDADEGELVWTDEARAFGGKLREAIIRIDSLLREGVESTPQPDWAGIAEYVLPREAALRQQVLELENQLAALESEQRRLKSKMADEAVLRGLLYEKGTPLESAIRSALEIMGFSAEPYRDSESEFDVVFESAEGRFIGEAEGRDNKAISISKLRQLEVNILEDFDRDEVSQMANGVLFGNAYRLRPVEERGSFFTAKVLTAAERRGTILVRAPDLFPVVRYLTAVDDDEYAASCRQALLDSCGEVVVFPAAPEAETESAGVQTTSE